MYKTAAEYYGRDKMPVSHLMEPYKNVHHGREDYVPLQKPLEQFSLPSPPPPKPVPETYKPGVEMKWNAEHYENLSDPRVWGPPFWFGLHMSAANYPINASPIVRDRMKARIMAIPYEIPCLKCKPHASAFIESRRDQLDEICSHRDKLFKFYVDFHNKVNQRYNKPIWSYKDAWKKYSGKAKVNRLTYN